MVRFTMVVAIAMTCGCELYEDRAEPLDAAPPQQTDDAPDCGPVPVAPFPTIDAAEGNVTLTEQDWHTMTDFRARAVAWMACRGGGVPAARDCGPRPARFDAVIQFPRAGVTCPTSGTVCMGEDQWLRWDESSAKADAYIACLLGER